MTEPILYPAHIPAKAGKNPSSITIAKHSSFADDPITFRNPPGEALVDYISDGVHISRGGNGGLINVLTEEEYHNNVSPQGTSWNSDGWEDFHLLANRNWTNFRNALDNNIGENIINSNDSKLVMRDNTTGKYYKVQFHFWQAGSGYGGEANNNETEETGGFSYTRQEIFMSESVSYENADPSSAGDPISEHVNVVRAAQGGIYNSLKEEEWNPAVSPAGLLWNTEGWDDLTNIGVREYHPLYPVTGALGQNIEDKDYVMYDVEADEYYQVKFYDWGTQVGSPGQFAYVRTKLNSWGSPEGIIFGDGTVQKNAAGEGLDKIKAEYWGYPNDNVQIKNAKDNNSIALASTSDAIVRWQAREEAEGVSIEALISKVDIGNGDWLVTLSVNPDRVMLDGYLYYVGDAGDYNGTFYADNGGEGTVSFIYDYEPEGDPTGGVIGGPSKYSQVQANEDGLYIKTAGWGADPGGSYQYFWQFMHDGGLKFPDGTIQYTAWLD